MRLGIHEIMKQVAAAEDITSKAEILRRYDSLSLKMFLYYALDPRVTWLLPDGDPPYKELDKSELIGAEYMLHKEARTMYLFVEGGLESNPNVKPQKREQLFIELLEHVHPADAKLLLAAKRRELPGLPRDAVDAAFPAMLAPRKNVITRVAAVVTDKVEAAKLRKRVGMRLRMREKRAAERAAKAEAALQAVAPTEPDQA